MEDEIRGSIENTIDTFSSPEQVEIAINFIRNYTPVITNERDAVFGFILGVLSMAFSSFFTELKGKSPSGQDFVQLMEILE